jgi:integrase
VPPPDLLPFRTQRPVPYLYSDEEVSRLLEAARQLPAVTGLRPHTYATLFGLYAVTGMRTNEPLHLDREDVDLTQGVLTVRGTKFGKSRYLPIDPSTQEVLQAYAERRDALCPHPLAPSFFLAERGTRLTESSVRWTFVKLSRQIGLRGPQDSRGPRLLDFRHRFAVQTLTRWYQSGEDAWRLLPVLSAYLGHVYVAGTYWYLSSQPELMAQAMDRLERRWGESS